jgi:hypothetical protein
MSQTGRRLMLSFGECKAALRRPRAEVLARRHDQSARRRPSGRRANMREQKEPAGMPCRPSIRGSAISSARAIPGAQGSSSVAPGGGTIPSAAASAARFLSNLACLAAASRSSRRSSAFAAVLAGCSAARGHFMPAILVVLSVIRRYRRRNSAPPTPDAESLCTAVDIVSSHNAAPLPGLPLAAAQC